MMLLQIPPPLYTLRSLSTDEGRKCCPNTINSRVLLFGPARLQIIQVMDEKPLLKMQ